MASLLHKAFFFCLALPAILRAVYRLLRHRGERLDLQVETLRRVDVFRIERLRRPAYLAASLDRVLSVLPPFGYGRCFKRSLLLLDLWGRCGFAPVLHLGVKTAAPFEDPGADASREFHAWVSTTDGGPWTSSQGHVEIWRN